MRHRRNMRNKQTTSHTAQQRQTKRTTRNLAWFASLGLVWWLAGCGGTPDPTPTAVPPTATATATPAPIEQIPTAVPVVATQAQAAETVRTTPPPASSPTVSVPPVVEEDDCSVEYDLDLAGYPDLDQRMGCALSKAEYDAVAINEFGEGPDYTRFMLWFSDEGQIYVLFPDQTWQAFLDTWSEDQPEISCNPLTVPPTSPPLPRRGFGKLWCTVEGLQDKLGTIEREERLCQHTVVQRFEKGRLLACFEDATIRYFRLLDDGNWDMVMIR